MAKTNKVRSNATAVAAKHRRIQRAQDAHDRPQARYKSGDNAAVQAGPREQPTRLPAQHIAKPGNDCLLYTSDAADE